MYLIFHWLHIVSAMKEHLGCLQVCSQIELPKYGDSFPIYTLKWHCQILPSVLDGYFIKASECSQFELLVIVLTFISEATSLYYNCCNLQVLLLPCNRPLLQLLQRNCQHILLSILHFHMLTDIGSTLIWTSMCYSLD